MAPSLTEVADIELQLTTHLSTPNGWKADWPGWLTYSGRFTRINGHPSATSRAQDRESSPTKDRRSTTVPRNQPLTLTLALRDQQSVDCMRWCVDNNVQEIFRCPVSGRHGVGQGNVKILQHVQSDRRDGTSTEVLLNLLIQFHLNNVTNLYLWSTITCHATWRSYIIHWCYFILSILILSYC